MKIADLTKLNCYTTLPVLLDLLKRRRLVLLDPKSWEDKNDSGVMEENKRRKKVPRLFALCFSWGDETIHQWKAFADGISGCCIEFDAQRIRVPMRLHKPARLFIRLKAVHLKLHLIAVGVGVIQ